ncbi:hypothetical protein D9M71_230200 [compost metagenome]
MKMKNMPRKPPHQCHQFSPRRAAKVGISRCQRVRAIRPAVPTRKEIIAAASTLDTCRASWPLIPACSGRQVPAISGRTYSHQGGVGMGNSLAMKNGKPGQRESQASAPSPAARPLAKQAVSR